MISERFLSNDYAWHQSFTPHKLELIISQRAPGRIAIAIVNISKFSVTIDETCSPKPSVYHTLGLLPREINIDTWIILPFSHSASLNHVYPFHKPWVSLISEHSNLWPTCLLFQFHCSSSAKAGQPSLWNTQPEVAISFFLTIKAIHVLCLTHTCIYIGNNKND